jgi:hypothetical protein
MPMEVWSNKYSGMFQLTWYCCMCCNFLNARLGFEGFKLIKSSNIVQILSFSTDQDQARYHTKKVSIISIYINSGVTSFITTNTSTFFLLWRIRDVVVDRSALEVRVVVRPVQRADHQRVLKFKTKYL